MTKKFMSMDGNTAAAHCAYAFTELLINNETETTQGILEIISDTRNEVTIINTETQAFYRSNAANTVKIVIE